MNFLRIFFQNLLPRVEYEWISGLKFFSLLLGQSHPILAKNNAGKGFFIFLNFFAIFFWNFLARVEVERNSGLKFFSLFFGLAYPILAKNNAGKSFVNFLIFFFYFFQNFLARVEYERNSGLKFFSLFLHLSHPILAKNNGGKSFFNFLNVLGIFFGISFHGSSMNGIQVKIFFFSFSAYLLPFWLKIMLERGFLIFWFFFIIFRNFLFRVEYERNTGLNFFSLSPPISFHFG